MFPHQSRHDRVLHSHCESQSRCLACHGSRFQHRSLNQLLSRDPLCGACRSALTLMRRWIHAEAFSVWGLYVYGSPLDQWFHQIKQLNDPVLASALLTPHRGSLRRLLNEAYLVYAPSTREQTQRRGFFALEALYAPLGLHIHHHLRKTGHEQKGLSATQRKTIGAAIELERPLPQGLKRIVVMEDVVTTGATAHSCVRQLRPFSPSVEVLSIAVHPLWLKKA